MVESVQTGVLGIGEWISFETTCKTSANNNAAHHSKRVKNSVFNEETLVFGVSKETPISEFDKI